MSRTAFERFFGRWLAFFSGIGLVVLVFLTYSSPTRDGYYLAVRHFMGNHIWSFAAGDLVLSFFLALAFKPLKRKGGK